MHCTPVKFKIQITSRISKSKDNKIHMRKIPDLGSLPVTYLVIEYAI